MDWLSLVGNGASIVGLGITIWVLRRTSSIDKAVERVERKLLFRADLQQATANLRLRHGEIHQFMRSATFDVRLFLESTGKLRSGLRTLYVDANLEGAHCKARILRWLWVAQLANRVPICPDGFSIYISRQVYPDLAELIETLETIARRLPLTGPR